MRYTVCFTCYDARFSDIELCTSSESNVRRSREICKWQKRKEKKSLKYSPRESIVQIDINLPKTFTTEVSVKVALPTLASQVYTVVPATRGSCVNTATLAPKPSTTPGGMLPVTSVSLTKNLILADVWLVATSQVTLRELNVLLSILWCVPIPTLNEGGELVLLETIIPGKRKKERH